MPTDPRDAARAQQIAREWESQLTVPVSMLALRQLATAIQQALADVRAENAEVMADALGTITHCPELAGVLHTWPIAQTVEKLRAVLARPTPARRGEQG